MNTKSNDYLEMQLGEGRISLPMRAVAIALLGIDKPISTEQVTVVERKFPRIGEEWREQGGVYAGIARGQDGKPDYHLILANHCEAENEDWDSAMKWAAMVCSSDEGLHDYALPTRKEQALLFANVPEHFEDAWYWSSEPHASNSDYAWLQYFATGYQDNFHKSYRDRARAVRRLTI